jgi:hypothetical protein
VSYNDFGSLLKHSWQAVESPCTSFLYDHQKCYFGFKM